MKVPEADFKHMNLKLSEQYGGREPFIPGITKKYTYLLLNMKKQILSNDKNTQPPLLNYAYNNTVSKSSDLFYGQQVHIYVGPPNK